MSGTTAKATEVSPEEEEHRIAEFRRQGFENRAMPHIIYHGSALACPWPGCNFAIAGIDFQLEKMSDKTCYTQLLRDYPKRGQDSWSRFEKQPSSPRFEESCPLFGQSLTAWWQGPGLVGRCPGCGQYVLFSMSGKQAVQDANAVGAALLPDDWHQTAYII